MRACMEVVSLREEWKSAVLARGRAEGAAGHRGFARLKRSLIVRHLAQNPLQHGPAGELVTTSSRKESALEAWEKSIAQMTRSSVVTSASKCSRLQSLRIPIGENASRGKPVSSLL